jgi:hypothetical protein
MIGCTLERRIFVRGSPGSVDRAVERISRWCRVRILALWTREVTG